MFQSERYKNIWSYFPYFVFLWCQIICKILLYVENFCYITLIKNLFSLNLFWIVSEKLRKKVVSNKIHEKIELFTLQLTNIFRGSIKNHIKKCLGHLPQSKFHQRSGGPVCFYCKSHLIGEKRWKSITIGKISFLKWNFQKIYFVGIFPP